MNESTPKAIKTDKEIPIGDNNFTNRQISYASKSAQEVKNADPEMKNYKHMGTVMCHVYSRSDGNGVQIVTIPLIDPTIVPENAANLMYDQIRTKLMSLYGRGPNGMLL